MAGFCKVCGVGLSAKNTVDYRPGSCRDCELERKRLYSNSSGLPRTKKAKKIKKTSKKSSKKVSKKKPSKKVRSSKKSNLSKAQKLKKLKTNLLKEKKRKKLAQLKLLKEKKKKILKAKLEKIKKEKRKKAEKLKILKRKKKDLERKEKEKLKLRFRKEKEQQRRAARQEKERLKKEKDKLRKLQRLEKDKVREEKRKDKDKVRSEKQKIRLERQQEKEKLKRAKEAAKVAIVKAKESARQAAHEARRLREDAKRQPIVSVVTTVKELAPPPNVKVIKSTHRKEDEGSAEKLPRTIDAMSLASMSSSAHSLLNSAPVISAKGDAIDSGVKKPDAFQKKEAEIPKSSDPIIDRYNPYDLKSSGPNAPRPPSPTPWLAPNFTVVEGDFKETKEDEVGASGGLSEEQVKNIIDKVKSDHSKKKPGSD